MLEAAILPLAAALSMVTTDWHCFVLVIVLIVVVAVVVALRTIIVALRQVGVLPSRLIPRKGTGDVGILGVSLDHLDDILPLQSTPFGLRHSDRENDVVVVCRQAFEQVK